MSCTSSIWRQNSNPQPLELESSPITTRPGLPPFLEIFNGPFLSALLPNNNYVIIVYLYVVVIIDHLLFMYLGISNSDIKNISSFKLSPG